MSYIKDPMAIERKSFVIIDEVIAENNWKMPVQTNVEKAIFHRVIHTSADFDYLENLKIKQSFIESFEKALMEPVTIYTDTNMVLSGINKSALSKTPWTIKCLVADERAKEIALEEKITRSMAAIQIALASEGKKMFVIGNAPTAIFQLMDLTVEKNPAVLGVVGVPVGFVGAAESKQMLYESAMPTIVALGRKGGSNVAAAIINALMYEFLGR